MTSIIPFSMAKVLESWGVTEPIKLPRPIYILNNRDYLTLRFHVQRALAAQWRVKTDPLQSEVHIVDVCGQDLCLEALSTALRCIWQECWRTRDDLVFKAHPDIVCEILDLGADAGLSPGSNCL